MWQKDAIAILTLIELSHFSFQVRGLARAFVYDVEQALLFRG